MLTFAEKNNKHQKRNSNSFNGFGKTQLNPHTFGNVLQRKCACGGSHNGSGECEECKKKKLSLQRKEANSLQTKLTINTPGDAYEKEADDMADKVMRMSVPENVNLKHNEDQGIQRKESKNNESLSTAPPIVNEIINSPGKPLDEETRAFMEPRFNYDFSNVKVHDNDIAAKSAGSINALAYTSGNNVVFNSGQYNSNSDSGKRLLAHELAHVVQQNYTGIRRQKKNRDKPKVDRSTFLRENCFGTDIDTSKANCTFTGYEASVIRLSRQYAERACSKAIFALDILDASELKSFYELIFHINDEKKFPSRKLIQITIGKVREKLEKTPIVCKNCFDDICNKGGIFAYVPPDHSLIEICPLYFNREKLTETPRFLIHEACHLADVDKDNYWRTKYNMEVYCNMPGEKVDYWNKPCPADIDNLKNADAWSFFIDRISITV